MTIQELHQDESHRQYAFPICKETVFLSHAGVAPLTQATILAIHDYLQRCQHHDQENALPSRFLHETRAICARLLACDIRQIALIGPTSVALSLVANGLDWQQGDNVIFYGGDFPSNVFPWMRLEEQGVELRRIHTTKLGNITLADIAPLIDRRTRLVALASVHFISGTRLDLDELGCYIHDHGALFCVDGIQSIGALHTSIRHVDFLAADAHKWMLGPCGAGILYVRHDVQKHLKPTLLGWSNVICPDFVSPETLCYPNHAGRYEAGSANFAGLVGMRASLELIQSYGIDAIETCLLNHTRFLRDELRKRDYLLASDDEHHLSGITSFRKDRIDMAALHQKLHDANIITTPRKCIHQKDWIRLSPHFYNTRQELEEVLGFL